MAPKIAPSSPRRNAFASLSPSLPVASSSTTSYQARSPNSHTFSSTSSAAIAPKHFSRCFPAATISGSCLSSIRSFLVLSGRALAPSTTEAVYSCHVWKASNAPALRTLLMIHRSFLLISEKGRFVLVLQERLEKYRSTWLEDKIVEGWKHLPSKVTSEADRRRGRFELLVRLKASHVKKTCHSILC
jgi:hypothetical protein